MFYSKYTNKRFYYKHSPWHGFSPSQLVFSQAMLRQMIFDLFFYSLICNICVTNYGALKKSPRSPTWTSIFAKCIWCFICLFKQNLTGWNDDLTPLKKTSLLKAIYGTVWLLQYAAFEIHVFSINRRTNSSTVSYSYWH